MSATPAAPRISPTLLRALADQAERADVSEEWPAASWRAVRETGALRWSIPPAQGGDGLSPVELLHGYQQLAGACLTSVFLLSQRDAAVRRLRDFGSPALQERYLAPLARGEGFITVGLSQLTTSRQHGRPALLATPQGDGFLLDGCVPWVTGAAEADTILVGATLADNRQVLVLVPRQRAGVTVLPSLRLCALQGSQTGEARLEGVRADAAEVLAGPVERVLSGSKGGGGLETSCLALGLGGAAVDYLTGEARVRPELASPAALFEAERERLRRRMYAHAGGCTPEEAASLRVAATRFALQAAQTALLTAKGTGFVHPHPVQRWARQALFFLVWSCPRPTSEGLLESLLPQA